MKKVFGFFLIGLGILTVILGISNGLFDSVPGAIGVLIGVSLITFLPAYFLLRTKKKFINPDDK